MALRLGSCSSGVSKDPGALEAQSPMVPDKPMRRLPLVVGFAMALAAEAVAPGLAALPTRSNQPDLFNLLQQLGLGLLLLAFCALLQLVATTVVMTWIHSRRFERWSRQRSLQSIVGTLLALFILFFTALIQILLWALLYRMGGALDSIGEALYFSVVTFTSLGYGDVTVGPTWQLVAGCEALSGLLLVGWSTALLVVVLQRVAALRQPERRN